MVYRPPWQKIARTPMMTSCMFFVARFFRSLGSARA